MCQDSLQNDLLDNNKNMIKPNKNMWTYLGEVVHGECQDHRSGGVWLVLLWLPSVIDIIELIPLFGRCS